jgi:predicted PurR-regulated permease PerM
VAEPTHSANSDLTRTFLFILILSGLIAASLWTLSPFISALIWATTIVVATWPLLKHLQTWLGGSRALAVVLMTLVISAVFVVPFGMAVAVMIELVVQGVEIVRTVLDKGLPQLPHWIVSIPWLGQEIETWYLDLAAHGPEGVAEVLRPYARSAASWTVAVTGGAGVVAVHFLLTVILAAILYAQGEVAADGVIAFARRIGGDRAEQTVRLAASAARGVALGVVVTALVQSLLAGVALWISGVPRAGVLLAVTFVLCVAQLGPLLVLVPAVVWLFWSGSTVWGVVLAIATVVVALIDNVLKPLLIRRGVDLPLLLLIAGVIGGLIGFGVVGLFIGPVLLAVTYTLLVAWVRDGNGQAASSPKRSA